MVQIFILEGRNGTDPSRTSGKLKLNITTCSRDLCHQLLQALIKQLLFIIQHAGKTTFVNVIASGSFNEDMIPTVGFNMRKITKGNVTIKLWDIGGQVSHQLLNNSQQTKESSETTVFHFTACNYFAAKISKYVGTILQRSQRNCIHGRCCRP